MNPHQDPLGLIDTELAGCRVAEEIGRGGMAIVYRAYQNRLDRWVAVKVLRPELLAVQEVLIRFRREAKAVAALHHPNILTIYDYGEERGFAYILMEYVTGKTLKEHLTGQPWDWPKAVALLAPVARALAYAHGQGIVHRDVKPANILLSSEDWPLLSDFGLVKLLEAQQDLTQPGTGLGTPLYTAPEQMLGEEVDHRADIYALATVLYEMLTGQLPFKATNPVQLTIERMNRLPESPRQRNPAVPNKLEQLVLQGLAAKPVDRQESMEVLAEVLEALHRSSRRRAVQETRPSTQIVQRGQVLLGPRLVTVGTNALVMLSLETENVIGRAAPYSDQVPDIDLSAHGGGRAGVSRLHACLLQRQGEWYVEDLNSTNGTTVNGQAVSPDQPVLLHDGDMIQFGNLAVVFYAS
jgi:serine/threonine protein kinase